MASTSAINAAGDIRTDYMKLLVTQLQNQDPLEPMDNNQMASQLTQFSQLEQLETMNQTFTQSLDAAQRTYANSLLGKEISFTDSENAETGLSSGIVSEVTTGADGQLMLRVGTRTVALADVVSVQNPSGTTTSY